MFQTLTGEAAHLVAAIRPASTAELPGRLRLIRPSDNIWTALLDGSRHRLLCLINVAVGADTNS